MSLTAPERETVITFSDAAGTLTPQPSSIQSLRNIRDPVLEEIAYLQARTRART